MEESRIIGYDENGPQYALSKKESVFILAGLTGGVAVWAAALYFFFRWVLS